MHADTGLMVKQVTRLMGNRFELGIYGETNEWALPRIEAAIEEIRRIEKLLTTYNEQSQTSLINRNAGLKPVKVDQEVFNLIERSLKISELTQGAFDISYGSIDKSLWNFDMHMTSLPDAKLALESVSLINYRNVLLDHGSCQVYLTEKGMRIGFGGIGKGYAADRAKFILQEQGVKSGIVNAAGDLVTWGTGPEEKPWTIGIADPDQSSVPFSTLNISNMAVATSGDYEKYVLIDGKKYSHTINPLTGLPVTGIKSVTIIAPGGELADAMATPVMVMGVGTGLDLINQLPTLACIIIDENGLLHTSKNIHLKN